MILAGIIAVSIGIVASFVFVVPEEIIQEEIIEEETEPAVITTVVDGVGCVMSDKMIFDKHTGYTTITLVCDPDILYHYLPSIDLDLVSGDL